MSDKPPNPFSLDELQPWLDLLRKDAIAASDYYFEHLLPRVIEHLETLPENKTLRAKQYGTLVSLMGFSPETTVIAAAIVHPKKLIVAVGQSTSDSPREQEMIIRSYRMAHKYLTGHKVLEPDQIEKCDVPSTDVVGIYEGLRRSIDRQGSHDDTKLLFDVTGGKKVMSATAGQVAWELRKPLLYIEGEYDNQIRRPRPGSEELMELPNPSSERKRILRQNALNAYGSRDYRKAVSQFHESRQQRKENRLDELGYDVCQVYQHWMDLNLTELALSLTKLQARLQEGRIRNLLEEHRCSASVYASHLSALQRVAAQDELALVATFLELAALYRELGRHDFACLLLYRAMEAIVAQGLRQHFGPKFDLSNPDWERCGLPDHFAERYVALSAKIDNESNRESTLPRRIGFVNGLALLVLLGSTHEAWTPPMRDTDFLKRMRSEAKRRNQSVLAHGNHTLTSADSDAMSSVAGKLARAVLSETHGHLEILRLQLKPLDLSVLDDRNEV